MYQACRIPSVRTVRNSLRGRLGRRSYGLAFTLTELLIVISVIAVIASLVIPMIGRTMSRVKNVKCTSNLRQIYAISMQYSQDNNQVIISNLDLNPKVASYSMLWDKMLQRFSDTGKAVIGERPPDIWACPASDGLVTSGHSSDYGKNKYINNDYRTNAITYKMTDLEPLPEILLFGEGNRDLWGHSPPWELIPRHDDKANVVYADGHTEAIDPNDLPSPDLWPLGPPWRPSVRAHW